MISENPLWVERFRPHTIEECILPVGLKRTFQKFVDSGTVPNLLLSGGSGVGKTTVAMALLDEIDAEYSIFNGSLNVDKDSLRNEIKNFASAMSLTKAGRKYVILDEADYLNVAHVQPALRGFIEEFSGNTGFILTCNFKNKIIKPLHSRCSVIDFQIPPKEVTDIANKFLDRIITILKAEGIDYDKIALVGVITKFFPDFRRIINEIQRYSVTGKIDSGILSNFTESSIKALIKFLKDKNFTASRKWVADNQDIEATDLFSTFYQVASEYLDPQSIPVLVLILSKYQYQHNFCADPAINTTACLVEIMSQVKFK